jgi:hypothetical protein
VPSESCPKCGEKAISNSGHCVFCGAVVIAPRTVTVGADYQKAMKTYRFVSPTFLVIGVLYLALAVIGSTMTRSPMLGLFVAGVVTTVHGGLLILNNDWVRSVTKVVCISRLAIFGFMFLILLPYMLGMGPVGIGFGILFLIDIGCLIMMIRTIDDVYFA